MGLSKAAAGPARTHVIFINNLIVKMFGDLKTAAGVKALNDYLAENSYIEGYVPSQADTAVFEALSGAPKDAPHALRWYNHIKSFAAGMKQFPKAQKDAASYVSGGAAAAAKDDDDDVDLFGSDEEEDDEEKSKKPALIAKTSVLLDVKPWDDETDMDAMLAAVKTIEMEGLVWGANKLVPVGYGIQKLQVMCVVEDAKVSIDELQEKIADFEDFVQSVDVAAMNKV